MKSRMWVAVTAIATCVAIVATATVALLAATTTTEAQGWACEEIPAPFDPDAEWYSPTWNCAQAEIDDMWNRFGMHQEDWDGQFGFDHPCDVRTPLHRTFNGMQVLKYGTTSAPHCNTFALDFGDWAYCWAGFNIGLGGFSRLKASCATDLAAEANYGFLASGNTTVKRPFFNWMNPVQRAATLVHEARHHEGWCGHVSNCAGGIDGCDPEFGPNGCQGTFSSSGFGAYGYGVLYYQWFLFSANPAYINQAMRDNARASANSILQTNFGTTPCISILPNGIAEPDPAACAQPTPTGPIKGPGGI